MLVALPGDIRAPTVADALAAQSELPVELRRSLTWDQGAKRWPNTRGHVDPGHVYFCDPRSPGSAERTENTNGLLRQLLPETDEPRGRSANATSIDCTQAQRTPSTTSAG